MPELGSDEIIASRAAHGKAGLPGPRLVSTGSTGSLVRKYTSCWQSGAWEAAEVAERQQSAALRRRARAAAEGYVVQSGPPGAHRVRDTQSGTAAVGR